MGPSFRHVFLRGSEETGDANIRQRYLSAASDIVLIQSMVMVHCPLHQAVNRGHMEDAGFGSHEVKLRCVFS